MLKLCFGNTILVNWMAYYCRESGGANGGNEQSTMGVGFDKGILDVLEL